MIMMGICPIGRMITMSSYDEPPQKSYETVEEVLEYPIMAISSRGISKETCEYWGVRTGLCERTNKPDAHYFPVKEKGEIVGWAKRRLNVPKEKSFYHIGKVKAESAEFFGQDLCQKGGLKLFIIEGQYDALSTWQALYEEQPNPGRYTPNVVSPLFGAIGSDEQFKQQDSFTTSFKEKIAVYDQDEAGEAGVTKLSFVYDDLLNVELSRNDANEVHLNEGAESLYKQVFFNAKKFVPDTVLEEVLPEEELYKPWTIVGDITTFPKLNKTLRRVRGGEMTVFLADTGVGKSTSLMYGFYRPKYPNR
jgi:hypothetical protein